MKIDQKINQETWPNQTYPPQKPDPEELPEPTLWPLGMAFGVLFIFWGLIASAGLTITGLIVAGVSLAGWITDLKPNENHDIKKI